MAAMDTQLDRLKERFLLAAARGGRLEEVVSLLELGADFENNLFGEQGEEENNDDDTENEAELDTPLVAAARAGHVEIVSVLLANGADPNRKAERGDHCALHAAAEHGHVEAYCTLIAHGAIESRENGEGMTARQMAQRGGHLRRILRGLRKAEGKDDWSQTDGSCSQCTDDEINGGDGDENGDNDAEDRASTTSDDGEESDTTDTDDEDDDEDDDESSCSSLSDDGSSVYDDLIVDEASTPSFVVVDEVRHYARVAAADLYLPMGESVGNSDASQETSALAPPAATNHEAAHNVRTLRERLARIRGYTSRSTVASDANDPNALRERLALIRSQNERVPSHLYDQAVSEKESLERANATLEQEKHRLLEKATQLKRMLDKAIRQKETALEYCKIAEATTRQAVQEKTDALARAEAAEQSNFERYFGVGSDSASLTLEELDSAETKLREALNTISEAKETHMRRRLEQQDTEKACVVCMEGNKTVLLLPCKHLCVCSHCSDRVELTHCPLCRIEIESKIKTFA